jgi:glycerol-3-phosphate dehydrogenase (NAD(P)+)
VNTTNVLIAVAEREGIAAPVSQQVYQLLHGKITPEMALATLMERDLKSEAVMLPNTKA